MSFPPVHPISEQVIAEGLLNVGPGSNTPYAPATTQNSPDVSKGNVAGVWGYFGVSIADVTPSSTLPNSPFQTSSPPRSCGVFGQVQSAGATKDPPPGVYGISDEGDGVRGESTSAKDSGVSGTNNSGGYGVFGTSSQNDGVKGESTSAKDSGVSGTNNSGGYGVFGTSSQNDGVHGESTSAKDSGVCGINTGGGRGVYGNGSPAGFFQGDVDVTGDVHVTGDVILVNSSGDVAEDFDVEDGSAHEEPGTVLVINSSGKLTASSDPYDTRVAGVVAGAGELKPAIVLQRVESRRGRSPIALIGKAFCKVDASFGSINPGDLLTTSSTPGHAMKVLDYAKATGAILGKALKDLENGRGLIPILVTPH